MWPRDNGQRRSGNGAAGTSGADRRHALSHWRRGRAGPAARFRARVHGAPGPGELHEGPKPAGPTSSCPATSESAVIDSVREALRHAGQRVVVVVAHHPSASGGVHGGPFGWQDHIFPLRNIKPWLWIPLPLIGSVYPIARAEGISRQDIPSRAYGRMRAALDSAFAGSPPLIYAAGPEHTLQGIAGTSTRYVLVSGTGTFGHIDPVTAPDSTRFARSAMGFMRVEILRDGRARLGVIIVDRAGNASEEFGLWLN